MAFWLCCCCCRVLAKVSIAAKEEARKPLWHERSMVTMRNEWKKVVWSLSQQHIAWQCYLAFCTPLSRVLFVLQLFGQVISQVIDCMPWIIICYFALWHCFIMMSSTIVVCHSLPLIIFWYTYLLGHILFSSPLERCGIFWVQKIGFGILWAKMQRMQ